MHQSNMRSRQTKNHMKGNHRRTKHIGKYVPWGYE